MSHPVATHPILLFDGVCNLCEHAVQFILENEASTDLRFASLQSDAGQQLLRDYHLPSDYAESLVFIHNHQAYTHSEAALKVSRFLKFPYALGRLGLFLPSTLRDVAYNWIARNRYRWFGKKDQCLMPTPERRSRFLDA